MDYSTNTVHVDVSQYNDTQYPYYDATFQQQPSAPYTDQDEISRLKFYPVPQSVDLSPCQRNFMSFPYTNAYFSQDISLVSCLPTPMSGASDGTPIGSEVFSDGSSPSEEQSSYFPLTHLYQPPQPELQQTQTYPMYTEDDNTFDHYKTTPQIHIDPPSISTSLEPSPNSTIISPLASPLDNSVMYSPISFNVSTLYRKRMLKARAEQQEQSHQSRHKKLRVNSVNPPSVNTPPAPSMNPDGTVHLDCNGRKPRQWRNRKYRCSHCDLQFYDRDLDKYAAHIEHIEMTEHPDASGRRFKCPESSCPWSKIGFARKLEQVKHHTRKHGNPTFECRFWAPDGAEKFPGACVCTTHWHADSGNRLRHERAVHGAVWSDEYEAKYQAHQALLAAVAA